MAAIRRLHLAAASALILGASAAPQLPNDAAAAVLDPTEALGRVCGMPGGGRPAWLKTLAAFEASGLADAATEGPMPLMTGLGDTHFPITTASPQAQAYFDQGLALSYGFNHDAAVRSFRAAQALDPDCAMCFWGEAFARGPNINAPMDATAGADAWKAIRQAEALSGKASGKERALIDALGERYVAEPLDDRASLDRNYAAAMRATQSVYPEDDHVAVLTAEAIMDTRPWDYWEADGRTPKGDIGQAIAMVEAVLARNPDQAQAIHLYIHLMEASTTPEKAEPFADRLARPLTPAAGHLVHMPGHLFYRIGRYRDAIRVNIDAARVDEAYFAASGDMGLYRFAYYPHNVHFIVTSAQMGGDGATAIAESERLLRVLSIDAALAFPPAQAVYAAPSFAHAQFSDPATILALPMPDARMPYVVGMWRYARAVARARQRDQAGFDAEIAALAKIRSGSDFTPMTAAFVPAPQLLELAEHVARGRLAYAQGRYEDAATHYRAAIVLEDAIPYMEPPYWYYPVRQSLGAALLAAGKPEEARQAFMESLARNPGNGWALHGLAETQRRLADRPGERATRAAFRRAWLGSGKPDLARL